MPTYTVKMGDTISKIARDVLGDISRWPEIAQLNNITSPFTIFPNQVLQLPDGTTDEASIFYKGEAGRAVTPTPTPTIQRAGVNVNWPLVALAIAGVGLLWYGFKK